MSLEEHRAALTPLISVFRNQEIYAYGILDDENRWSVAADLEDGHIDVRIGADGYDLDVWATLTGMYADEEQERRRFALERLARISIPGLQRGFSSEGNVLDWDDAEHGIRLRQSAVVPFSAAHRLPEIALSQLANLQNALLVIERQLR
jgi:hypothetical protein